MVSAPRSFKTPALWGPKAARNQQGAVQTLSPWRVTPENIHSRPLTPSAEWGSPPPAPPARRAPRGSGYSPPLSSLGEHAGGISWEGHPPFGHSAPARGSLDNPGLGGEEGRLAGRRRASPPGGDGTGDPAEAVPRAPNGPRGPVGRATETLLRKQEGPSVPEVLRHTVPGEAGACLTLLVSAGADVEEQTPLRAGGPSHAAWAWPCPQEKGPLSRNAQLSPAAPRPLQGTLPRTGASIPEPHLAVTQPQLPSARSLSRPLPRATAGTEALPWPPRTPPGLEKPQTILLPWGPRGRHDRGRGPCFLTPRMVRSQLPPVCQTQGRPLRRKPSSGKTLESQEGGGARLPTSPGPGSPGHSHLWGCTDQSPTAGASKPL